MGLYTNAHILTVADVSFDAGRQTKDLLLSSNMIKLNVLK